LDLDLPWDVQGGLTRRAETAEREKAGARGSRMILGRVGQAREASEVTVMAGKGLDFRLVPTTCVYCGTGCGVLLQADGGRLTGTLPRKDHPVSRGSLCIKGWAAHEFVHSPRRLTRPMVRRDGELVETDWETALRAVGEGLMRVRDEHGPDAVGFLASARCTNEENYLLMKLARAVVGTNNVDHCARL